MQKIVIIIVFVIIDSFLYKKYSSISIINENYNKSKLIKEIEIIYNKYSKVNINKIDDRINKMKKNSKNLASIINIGVTLDKNFVLETMVTLASIMATQKKNTKIRFHLGVTNNFTAEKMVKIYELRKRINNLTEFNFYYLKESVTKMKGFHKTKGETCPGKFELPLYLPNDVEKILIFDVGDLLVLRDLTDLYNYKMENYWVLGTPEPTIIKSFMEVKYNITKYLNVGSLLLNVKKIRENNFWLNFTKNRYIELVGQPEQTLFNIIIPDDKKNYIPFKFGGFTLFRNDSEYESLHYLPCGFTYFFNSNLSSFLPENPKSKIGLISQLYNPVFIHQFYGKWKNGEGLTIYRHLTKYFISLTGISEEICKEKPGYCI